MAQAKDELKLLGQKWGYKGQASMKGKAWDFLSLN